ncbi:hypothetical protein BJV74DRAFT_817632 [Russula compacta]|nr:hypothetical protein BJV74DRAFT_817632 [Russula compacta]
MSRDETDEEHMNRSNGPANSQPNSHSTRRTMPKGLRLKRTPAEQAERDLRKARRAAKKAASRPYLAQDGDFRPSKRSGTLGDEEVNSNHPFLDPGPSTSRYDARGVPVTDDGFQERLWDAVDEDRLDAIEARLNDYAHVPRRWRGVGPQAYGPDITSGLENNPELMNDDEYAEWVRVGMWRKRHAAAHHEQQQQKAAHAAAKADAVRILQAKEDARRHAREERERRRHADARDAHEQRWAELLKSTSKPADLSFGDIPWPVRGRALDVSQLTVEAVSAFLFFPEEEEGLDEAGRARIRKEELRKAMLRFHPDKFEGRVIPRIQDEERAAAREGANVVTRAVRTLS